MNDPRQYMVTVKEFIEILQQQDQNRVVVMSKDGEGNNFSPFAEIGRSAYKPDSTWSGEVGLEKLTDELKAEGYGEEDVVDGVPALVLWPVN